MTAKVTSNSEKSLDAAELLQSEFAARSARNPRYSLRAFAKSMGVSHSILSLILSKKRRISRKLSLKLANALCFNPVFKKEFLDFNNPNLRVIRHTPQKLYQTLSMDSFALIADWYHFAILSLLDLKGAKPQPEWIAARLGITLSQAKEALERLNRLGLLNGAPLKLDNTYVSQAATHYNRQLLERATDHLDTCTKGLQEHDYSSMTFVLDPASLPYARQRIKEFKRALVEELESRGNPSEVYQMAIQVFPVSRADTPLAGQNLDLENQKNSRRIKRNVQKTKRIKRNV